MCRENIEAKGARLPPDWQLQDTNDSLSDQNYKYGKFYYTRAGLYLFITGKVKNLYLRTCTHTCTLIDSIK